MKSSKIKAVYYIGKPFAEPQYSYKETTINEIIKRAQRTAYPSESLNVETRAEVPFFLTTIKR